MTSSRSTPAAPVFVRHFTSRPAGRSQTRFLRRNLLAFDKGNLKVSLRQAIQRTSSCVRICALSVVRAGASTLVAFAFACILCAVCKAGEANESEYSGELKFFTNPRSTNVPTFRRTYVFQMAVKDALWRIRIRNTENASSSLRTLYHEIGYDGTNIATIEFISPATVTVTNIQSARSKVPVTTNMVLSPSATIIPGPIPPVEFADSTVLWLALSAKRHFVTNSISNRLNPVWHVPYDEFIRERFSTHWNFHSSAPFHLSNLSMESDGTTRTTTGAVIKWPKPYDQGFTLVHFQVTDWSSPSSGQIVPKSFRLTVNEPKNSGRSTNDLATIMTWEGHVTNVSQTLTLGVGLPIIRGKTIVTDFRHNLSDGKQKPKGIIYANTSNWPEVDAPLLKRLVTIELESKPKKGGALLTMVALFLITTAGFIYFVLQHKKRQ